MIKIEVNNIDKVKEDHFTGVQGIVIPRAKLLLTAFRVINGDLPMQDIFDDPIQAKTKTGLLKFLVRQKATIKKKADYHRITTPLNIVQHYYDNRLNYINLFQLLSDETTLRNLILADIDELINQSLAFTEPWLQPISIALVNRVIDYDKFNKKGTSPYNAYCLAESLQVNVCPYCNRTYTSTIIKENRNMVVKPTFDHFYNQAAHPFLALSFYNLIPSCANCNSYLKGEKGFQLTSHLHPFVDGFGKDAQFDFLFKEYKPERSHPGNYQVFIRTDSSSSKHTRITGNLQDFELREIYKSHADVVGEISVKVDKESPYYAMALFKSLPSLPASKREFYRFYFGNYFDEKDFNKRPLAKLTKDIVSKYLPDITE